jgi:hypothetical protein
MTIGVDSFQPETSSQSLGRCRFVAKTYLTISGIESIALLLSIEKGTALGFELGFFVFVASDIVHEYDGRKFMVDVVVEIARNEPARIEDRDRCLPHSSLGRSIIE